MVIELRPGEAGDGDAVAAIFGAARDAALAFLPALHSAAEDREHFAGYVERGGVTVAVVDGLVAGFLALGEARVEHLYVTPAHWRRGIGTLLLRGAQAARPAGLDLWVFQRNAAAIAFYERHGFAIVETTAGEGNEEREPDHRMAWPGA